MGTGRKLVRENRHGSREKGVSSLDSPLRLLVLMAVAIFTCETLVMLVLDRIPRVSHSVEAVIDSTILIIILSPTFYLLWFRPFMHQITERRRSEAEIRRLSHQLLNSAEIERKRLARDLHDEFGQSMTALLLDLESLQRVCPGTADPDRKVIDRIIGAVRTLNDQVRNFSSELRPQMLDEMGIIPTLQWYVRDFLSHGRGLQVDFRAVGLKRRLPAEMEIVLYRICQESLNNIVKHAGAEQVWIWLTYCHPKIILTIRDDGKGFDCRAPHKGFGLLGIRERAALVGGALHLTSAPGKGTTVRAELPVAWEHEHG